MTALFLYISDEICLNCYFVKFVFQHSCSCKNECTSTVIVNKWLYVFYPSLFFNETQTWPIRSRLESGIDDIYAKKHPEQNFKKAWFIMAFVCEKQGRKLWHFLFLFCARLFVVICMPDSSYSLQMLNNSVNMSFVHVCVHFRARIWLYLASLAQPNYADCGVLSFFLPGIGPDFDRPSRAAITTDSRALLKMQCFIRRLLCSPSSKVKAKFLVWHIYTKWWMYSAHVCGFLCRLLAAPLPEQSSGVQRADRFF